MTLAHEYGHIMIDDRHKPGVDYVHSLRKPVNEKFVDAFAMAFLMPASGVRRLFHDVINRSGDFQVADLVRAALYFAVSAQAMTLRLERIGLLANGTWESLKNSGLKPEAAHQDIGEAPVGDEGSDAVPARFRSLAVQAFQQDLIGEGELAKLLRVDRIRARELVQETQAVSDVTDGGESGQLFLPFERSLVNKAG
jgi:Zn-dependent peptidase ImmA (M78 family)